MGSETGRGAAPVPGGSDAGRFVDRPLCPQGNGVAAVGATEPCEAQARPLVLAATILASSMAFIDGTVVTIALPSLQGDLGAGFSALQWVVNAYALLLGSLILIGGGAGDRFGRRRVFVVGIAIFAAASLACALAPNAAALIAARALQGFGAALLVPQSLAIIAASFPKAVRGRAIGVWAGASAITTAMGPPLGGFLIDALDWRAVFWINLPLSAAAVWLAQRHIPESRAAGEPGPLDWRGAALALLAFGALTGGLTLIAETRSASPAALLLLAAGVAALALFVLAEARAAAPLMPLELFRDRGFTAANAMTLFLYGALAGMLFLLPFELIERRGLSATQVGATLLPLGAIIGAMSRFSGGLADRHGPHRLLVGGSALVALAAGWLALALPGYWLGVMAPVALLAAGMGLVVAPLTTAVMNAAADARAGAASGVNNAASRLAGLFAVAILGSIAGLAFFAQLDGTGPIAADGLRFGTLPEPGAPGRQALEAAFLAGYAAALWTAALWGALAALVAWGFLRRPRPMPPGA